MDFGTNLKRYMQENVKMFKSLKKNLKQMKNQGNMNQGYGGN